MLNVGVSPAEQALPAPVLVVEDDSLMRQRLERILADLGYSWLPLLRHWLRRASA
jgi:PleD family two-component response regulator